MPWADRYIERLSNGETITFDAPNGNSMRPKIVPRQTVTVEPVTADTKLKTGDVVLCKVRNSQYLHLIKGIRYSDDQFLISNNHGHANGWTARANIYGKLVK